MDPQLTILRAANHQPEPTLTPKENPLHLPLSELEEAKKGPSLRLQVNFRSKFICFFVNKTCETLWVPQCLLATSNLPTRYFLCWLRVFFCSSGFSPLVARGNGRTEERGSSGSPEERANGRTDSGSPEERENGRTRFFGSPVLRGAWTLEPLDQKNNGNQLRVNFMLHFRWDLWTMGLWVSGRRLWASELRYLRSEHFQVASGRIGSHWSHLISLRLLPCISRKAHVKIQKLPPIFVQDAQVKPRKSRSLTGGTTTATCVAPRPWSIMKWVSESLFRDPFFNFDSFHSFWCSFSSFCFPHFL